MPELINPVLEQLLNLLKTPNLYNIRCSILQRMKKASIVNRDKIWVTGCSTVVEHSPCDQDVVGSKPACFSTLLLHSPSIPISSVSLIRSLQTELNFHKKILCSAAWSKQTLMFTELAQNTGFFLPCSIRRSQLSFLGK